MGLSISDLTEIIGVLKLYRPKQKEFANKSALLVSGRMNSAMVTMFTTMTKMLAFKYKVLKDEKSAESFLLIKD